MQGANQYTFVEFKTSVISVHKSYAVREKQMFSMAELDGLYGRYLESYLGRENCRSYFSIPPSCEGVCLLGYLKFNTVNT